jgi:WD40 repeat protein
LVASGQDGDKPHVRIWDFETGKLFTVIHPPIKSVECISFSCDRSFLAVSGRDAKNKETIVIYDVVELNSHTKPIQITKQISNFNIISMRFSPIDPYLLLT